MRVSCTISTQMQVSGGNQRAVIFEQVRPPRLKDSKAMTLSGAIMRHPEIAELLLPTLRPDLHLFDVSAACSKAFTALLTTSATRRSTGETSKFGL